MKKMLIAFALTLLFVVNIHLQYSFAQSYTTIGLPEDTNARLGKGEIKDIAFTKDGTRLIVAGSIGIWFYDAETNEPQDLLTGHTSTVNSIALSPDGETLASASSDNTIRLWNINTGSHLRTLTGHTSA